MPPSFIWALLIIKDFLSCPPSVGCDPSQSIFLKKKSIRFKRGPQGILLHCERITKDDLHFKCKHLGLISFAFFHVNMKNGFSLFMQPKLSFEVILWCLSCSSAFPFLGDCLNF
jgi:hypothetical protein